MDFWRKKEPKVTCCLCSEEVIVNISHITSSLSLCRFLLTKWVKIVHDHLYLDCHTQPWVIFLTSIVENSKDTLVKILLNGWWIFVQMIQSDPSYLCTCHSGYFKFYVIICNSLIFTFNNLFVSPLISKPYFYILRWSHDLSFPVLQKYNFGFFPSYLGDLERELDLI